MPDEKQVTAANPENFLDCDIKSSKKTRAPNPPPSLEEHEVEFGVKQNGDNSFNIEEPLKSYKEIIHSSNATFALSSNTATVSNSNFQMKEKPYPTINPKFRSLNNLSSKENVEQEKIKKPSTPEPAPRHSLSLSQDCLATDGDKNKKKNKFSIKKFLRMGNSSKQVEPAKRDYGHYGEVPTVSSEVTHYGAPQVKPRLIIIHPLDINTSAVQVVKSADVTPTSTPSPQTPTSIGKNIFPNLTSKPPAPPLRADTTKLQELHKPARPPPPKSAEMRRKQQLTSLITVTEGNNADNLYANLGEVRSAIAPRKPERTASMREREAKLEILRRRPIGDNADSLNSSFSSTSTMKNDSFSSGSSRNGSEKSFSLHKEKEENAVDFKEIKNTNDLKEIPKTSTDSFNERKKKILEMESNIAMNSPVTPLNKLFSKIEIFENNTKAKSPAPIKHSTYFINNDGLKSSVQKMTSTIDSYLKNKKTLSASETNLLEQPLANSARNAIKSSPNNVSNIELRASPANNYETITISGGTMTNGLKQACQRASYPDNGSTYGGESQNGSLYRNGRHSQDFGLYAAPANSFGELTLFILWRF